MTRFDNCDEAERLACLFARGVAAAGSMPAAGTCQKAESCHTDMPPAIPAVIAAIIAGMV